MRGLTLRTIAQACGGRLCREEDGCPDREVRGVVIDSRKVEEGYVFIAVKGERVDGHGYISEVMGKGAAGVVCESEPDTASGAYILVENSLQALKEIAEYYRRQLDLPVVGVTGSVGKTSTKEMIAAVLSKRFRVLKTQGNYNNEIGLPLTILQIREDHEAAVLEMGISHFGEMHRLSRMAKPDICVMTNIGQSHLESLGSREGILKAKSEIFDYMAEDGYVCVNGDDDLLCSIGEVKGRKPLRFGQGEGNDFRAGEVNSRGLLGSDAVIRHGEASFPISIPLPGSHTVYNALAAACVGHLLGMDDGQIAEGIAGIEPVSGRSHLIRLGDKVVIDDCYNANPVSMMTALDLLAQADTRRVAVLGDMFELGGDSGAMHEGVGRYAVLKGIEVIICVGSESERMYGGAVEEAGDEGQEIRYFRTKQELLGALPEIVRGKDTVLVKASHGMGFSEVVEALATPEACSENKFSG